MGVVVQFNYEAWCLRYPEFENVEEGLVTQFFTEATLFHANDGSGPEADPARQLMYLNMMTAHICKLNAPLDGDQSPQLVGRISNASEGSVSAQVENDYPPGSPQWFQQTKYGAAYWAATAKYRTMRYIRGHQRPMNPYFGGNFGWPFK